MFNSKFLNDEFYNTLLFYSLEFPQVQKQSLYAATTIWENDKGVLQLLLDIGYLLKLYINSEDLSCRYVLSSSGIAFINVEFSKILDNCIYHLAGPLVYNKLFRVLDLDSFPMLLTHDNNTVRNCASEVFDERTGNIRPARLDKEPESNGDTNFRFIGNFSSVTEYKYLKTPFIYNA